MEVLNQVQEIFRDFFDDQSLLLTERTTAKDIEDWDSLAHLNLMVLLEKHFKMRFKIDEIPELKNIGDILALIKARTCG